MENVNPPTADPASTDPPRYLPEALDAAHRMTRERLRFVLPTTAISLGAYVLIAALTGFTDVLDHKVHGAMSFILLLLMLLVPLVWVLAIAYSKRADRWDAMATEIRASIDLEPPR